MAESSLIKKLGIRQGQKLLVLNGPQGYVQILGTLPSGTEVQTSAGGDAFDFVQVFVNSKADVESYVTQALQMLKPGGLLWWTYPKKSAKVQTDITRDKGWESLQEAGFRPVTQIAIDETWSALRFRPVSEVKTQ